jgi:hypothetical protein
MTHEPSPAGEWGRRLTPARRQIQPSGEIHSSKRKKVKGNESKIAFVFFHLFFGIVTFQMVTPDSNKNFPGRLSSRRGL